MITPDQVPVTDVLWPRGHRIIRTTHPPIDLFEDIADPEDWPQLISAAQKTNPRLMESIGNLDLVPQTRRVSGPGASDLMAPFTHTSPDRPSRFSDGHLGVLYVAEDFDTAVAETAHHHAAFMAMTTQAPGWTSQFCALQLVVDAALLDLRQAEAADLLDKTDYRAAQTFGAAARTAGVDGLLYPSVRAEGDCVGLFYPDLARNPRRTRYLDYHFDGERVDLIRDITSAQVFRVID